MQQKNILWTSVCSLHWRMETSSSWWQSWIAVEADRKNDVCKHLYLEGEGGEGAATNNENIPFVQHLFIDVILQKYLIFSNNLCWYTLHWPFYSMKLLHCRLETTSHITKILYSIPIATYRDLCPIKYSCGDFSSPMTVLHLFISCIVGQWI